MSDLEVISRKHFVSSVNLSIPDIMVDGKSFIKIRKKQRTQYATLGNTRDYSLEGRAVSNRDTLGSVT